MEPALRAAWKEQEDGCSPNTGFSNKETTAPNSVAVLKNENKALKDALLLLRQKVVLRPAAPAAESGHTLDWGAAKALPPDASLHGSALCLLARFPHQLAYLPPFAPLSE